MRGWRGQKRVFLSEKEIDISSQWHYILNRNDEHSHNTHELVLFFFFNSLCTHQKVLFLLLGYFRILYRFLSRIAARFIAFCSSMYIVTALIVRQRVHELGRKADNFLIVTFTVFVSVGRKRNRASACTAIKWYQGLEAYSRELLLNRINR